MFSKNPTITNLINVSFNLIKIKFTVNSVDANHFHFSIAQISDMQELMDRFIKEGLTPQQARDSLEAIAQWLEEEYPVAGVLLKSWIGENHSSDQS